MEGRGGGGLRGYRYSLINYGGICTHWYKKAKNLMQEIFTHLICIYLKAKLHMYIVHLQLGKAANCKFYAEKKQNRKSQDGPQS